MAEAKKEQSGDELIVIDPPESDGQPKTVTQSMVVPRRQPVSAAEISFRVAIEELQHELRNMLTGAMGHSELAKVQCRESQKSCHVAPACPQALANINRALGCLGDMQEYIRGMDKFILEEVNLSDILCEAIICRINVHGKTYGIGVEHVIPPDVKISGNRLALKQIFSNLINNAFEATRSIPGRKGHIKISLTEKDGSVTCIVRDNGCGIPAEARDQIGQWGYTTKPDGHGRGLTISENLINKMSGSLNLVNNCEIEAGENDSDKMAGASAIIVFPALAHDQESL
jgi:signal transduction histidine kinase